MQVYLLLGNQWLRRKMSAFFSGYALLSICPFFRLWFDFWICSAQTFCTLSSPSQATHYLTLPSDRITSTTKATPLPTTRNVNIVATNIKHGGWVSVNSPSNLYLILTAAQTDWFHFSRQFSEDVGDVQVSHGFVFNQILGLFLAIDLRTLIWSEYQ